MPKRKCQFPDVFTRQCKSLVGEKEFRSEQHRMSVEVKTLNMLFGRTSGRNKNSNVANGHSGSETSIEKIDTKKVGDCCCSVSTVQKSSNCTYCEKNLCTGCTSVCAQCGHDFCHSCVFMKYLSAEDLHVCLSCYT